MQRSDIRVLVIDDNAVIRSAFTSILEDAGCQVLTAVDGENGLDTALSILPDIIFLDVMMPGMDGFQVLEKMRRMRRTKKIPVIIVTARTDTGTLIKALKIGATDFIAKPFVKADVCQKMNFALMNQGQRRKKTEAILIKDSSTFINGKSFQRMKENFIQNFEHVYLNIIKLISERRQEELKLVVVRLIDAINFYKFQGVEEEIQQMLTAINGRQWDEIFDVLEKIYQMFQDLRRVLPLAR